MSTTAASLVQAHLLGLRHDVEFRPIGGRERDAAVSERRKPRNGDASQPLGVSFYHHGRTMFAQGSRCSPEDLKLKPFHVNLDQRRPPELMAEIVDRCRSHFSVADMRRGFRKVGNGSLTHDCNLTESIESGLSFDFGGVRWVRLDRDNQSRWPDGTSSHETVEATVRANVKKRAAGRKNLGDRPLDLRFECPEPILRHKVAFGTPPSQALRVAQTNHCHAAVTMEREDA